MGRTSKSLALILILIMAMSSLNLLMIKPAYAQSIPTPSVPEFTLKPIGPPYVENTTYSLDPNTGQIVAIIGYTNPYSLVEIIIKNQPFIPYNDSQGNTISMFYNVQVAVHNQTDSWISLYEPDSGSLAPSTPDSDYTNISLWLNNGPLPVGTTHIDVQVEAFIGYVHKANGGYLAGWVFTGDTSDWSNTQTITVPANTPQLTPTPTLTSVDNALNSSLLLIALVVIAFLLAIIIFLLFYMRKRKLINSSQ